MGKCYNSTVVNSSIETVWDTLKDFHKVSWGDKVITKIDVVGDIAGSDAGAKRILNDAFHETLLSVDNDNCTFSYSIDDGPGPVAKDVISNYVGKVVLSPITDSGQTFIDWTSTFQ